MKTLDWWLAVLLCALLSACGGGGGSSGASTFGSGSGSSGGSTGGGTGTVAQPSIAVSLSTSTVTGATPATVTATVKDATGAGVAGQVVAFDTAGGLGKFSAPSALTDATGTATVSLQPKAAGTTGADQVVASTTVNGTAVTANAGFQLTATQVTIASFTSDVTKLSAYGQANISVTLGGTTAGVPLNVAIASACVSKGKATLTPSNVTTSTGAATFTYRDNGCGSTDANDPLQASITGTSVTAALSISLTSPTVSSVTFSSATPQTVFLKGTGLNETSEVVFQIRDTAGNGLANQQVILTMVSLAGDVTLDGGAMSVTKLSDSLGNVTARVNAGTVPTSVRIRATLTTPSGDISTVSSALAVAVGLPSQLNFSLSQGAKNIEGFNVDGTPNTYQIIASDRLGNPVPDGTSINFITEGGQVEAVKFTQTTNGIARAVANFVSSAPRPVDGRVTVIAYALGEESFLDANGNNVYDGGEDYQDLGNIFLDRSFNNVYSQALDQLIPLNISGTATCHAPTTSSNSLLNLDVSIPSVPNTCVTGWGRAYVRRAIETVFSTSVARPLWAGPNPNLYATSCPAQVPLLTNASDDPVTDIGDSTKTTSYSLVNGSLLYNLGAVGVISFLASDANGYRLNPVAAGTVISASATDGISATVAGGTPVPSTLSATFATIQYKFNAPTTDGVLTIKLLSPGGLETLIPVSIHAGPPGSGLVPCP